MTNDFVAVEGVHGDAVAIARGWAELFGLNVRVRKQIEIFVVEQARVRPFAVAGNHLDIKTHVMRCGGDAARAVGGDDGGRFAEAAEARESVIVLESAVVFCGAVARVERNDGLGLRHAERIEDAFAVDVGEETAIKGHEQVAQKVECGVVVVKELAGSVGGAMFCGRIGEENIRNAGKAGSVREEMVDGDGFEGRIDTEPRQVVDDRLLEVELAFLVELKKAVGEEALADGADLEEMIGRDTDFLFDVAEAVGDNALDGISIGENESEAWGVHGAEVFLDEGIERFIEGLVGRGRARERNVERVEI